MVGCNLHPVVKLCVPRALTTVMLDLMVPPETQVLMESEMSMMGWVLQTDLSSDQEEIPLLMLLKERGERGLT